MGGAEAGQGVPVGKLILVPAVLSLGITLLRLVGELRNWSPIFFNRAAGGGFAVVGIVWLVPILGVYFALNLAGVGQGPASKGRAIGFALGSLLVLPAAAGVAALLGFREPRLGQIVVFAVASLVAIPIAYRGWPALGATLLGYGLSARIPVAAVMLIAILNNWGTHYELGTPNLPEMGLVTKWVVIGLVPQLTFWMAFTAVVGAIFGSVALAVARRERPATA